jgi:hypothetical protein
MTQTLHLKTEFELPATARSFRKEIGNMTIIAESECMGKARKLSTDIEMALEYGAYPAAHALLIERINEANKNGQPLACTLQFSP